MFGKQILLVLTAHLILVLFSASLFAAPPAPSPWRLQMESNLGLAQSSYSNNWVGGEAGSMTWVSNFLGKAERQFSTSWFEGNELKLQFGQTHSQRQSDKHWLPPQKSADQIRYDGIVRYTRGWFVDPYVGLTFESQFLDASDSLKHRYLNPIDLTEATGFARTLIEKPDVNVLTTRLGFGLKQRFTAFSDPADPTHEKTLRQNTNDGGIEWVTHLVLGSPKKPYNFDSRLTVFQALFHSIHSDIALPPQNDNWKTATANWDNTVSVNVTKILQVGLAWQLLYDKQIALGGRFRETLSLGLAYKFANYTEEKK
ncbi:MAG TPA: DUF3078 domain-containing protein [bacterium]|jgi:hypothetical protein